jgi:hypothetical protein
LCPAAAAAAGGECSAAVGAARGLTFIQRPATVWMVAPASTARQQHQDGEFACIIVVTSSTAQS